VQHHHLGSSLRFSPHQTRANSKASHCRSPCLAEHVRNERDSRLRVQGFDGRQRPMARRRDAEEGRLGMARSLLFAERQRAYDCAMLAHARPSHSFGLFIARHLAAAAVSSAVIFLAQAALVLLEGEGRRCTRTRTALGAPR
jgi:hypothetical protein